MTEDESHDLGYSSMAFTNMSTDDLTESTAVDIDEIW